MAFDSTDEPFGRALAELLREHDYVTRTGNVNWKSFADELDGVHYETLRKAVIGERPVSPDLMEKCALALRIKPGYFAEYRLHEAMHEFDVREVGFDAALENLRAWATRQAGKRKRR